MQKKLGFPVNAEVDPTSNPFLDWHVNLFNHDQHQYVIITNSESLLTLLLHGKGLGGQNGRFIESFQFVCREYLKLENLELVYENMVSRCFNPILFTSETNRSVLGSMNSLVEDIKDIMYRHPNHGPFEIMQNLNRTPLSVNEFEFAIDVFKQMKIKTKPT